MAELACFVSFSLTEDKVKWFPINKKAIKTMLCAKVDKSQRSNYYDTVLFGVATPPEFRNRFKTSERYGLDYESDQYSEVATLLAEVLNMVSMPTEKFSFDIVKTVVQVRHLENLLTRIKDTDDILNENVKLRVKAVMIASNLVNEIETTPLTESNDIVYQDSYFTVTKLDYSNHKILPLMADEYKITINTKTDIPERDQTAFAAYLRYNYNKFAAISHGKRHWRLVLHSQLMSHAERLDRKIKSDKKHGRQFAYDDGDMAFVHPGWKACIGQLCGGTTFDVAKTSLYSVKTSKTVRTATSKIESDLISMVGN
uniref:Non-structural protein 2 n=1 Tax=Rotavirus C TaxID=36427 RepID=A0A5Q2V408_9REOV|nr:nonstructural RNA-binding protein 2 [Rotavirus C]QGH58925.1 nonstructural RNA-binding protein 2 [Rotavirus C]